MDQLERMFTEKANKDAPPSLRRKLPKDEDDAPEDKPEPSGESQHLQQQPENSQRAGHHTLRHCLRPR